jgi:NAD(P)H-flavin reductase
MFRPARIASVEPIGGGLWGVRLDVADETRASYTHVGQYTQVRAAGDEAYFLLANDPATQAAWELVVRPKGQVAEALVRARPGDAVETADAMGAGFDWAKTADLRLAVVVAGSGWAAAPPVLRARIREGLAAETALLVGVDDVRDPPALAALESYRASGVLVTLCVLPKGTDVGAVPEAPLPHDLPVFHGTAESRLRRALGPMGSDGAPEDGVAWAAIAVGPDALVQGLHALAREHKALRHVLLNV